MGGKAKTQKHSAKELQGKAFAATVNRGGGSAGLADRKGGKAGHAKFKCPVCGQQAPSLKNMEEHHDAKHPKIAFNAEACQDLHAAFGGSTQGVAVRGGLGKK